MFVALPSAIAFGVTVYGSFGPAYVARGATAGVVGALVLGLLAPLLGGAPRLITAPCAPAAAIMGALAADLIHGLPDLGDPMPPDRAVLFILLVGLLAGLLQVVYGLLQGGQLIKYIPYPVVSGYLSGVGIIIIAGQIPKWLGTPDRLSLLSAVAHPGQWRWPAVVVGAVTMTGVVLGPRWTRRVPASILGLFSGLLAYLAFAAVWPELRQLPGNTLLVGNVPTTSGHDLAAAPWWRQVGTFSWMEMRALLVSALMLSLLLSVDTLKTCLVLDVLTRGRHDSNRELLAQGVANTVSALLSGMPGSGVMGATLVNVHGGGQTRWSGVLEGVWTLVAVVALSAWLGWIPMAALGGLLIVLAVRMIDWRSLRLLRRRSTILDFVVSLAVVVVAVGTNLVAAAAVGLMLAVVLFIREQMRGSVVRRRTSLQTVSSKRQRAAEEREWLQRHGHAVTVCELQGSLFFGTADRLFAELEGDLSRCRCLILDMRRVQSVDYTAAHLLKQMESMMAGRQGTLILSNLPAHSPTGRDLEVYFGEVGLVKPTRRVMVTDTLDEALEWAEDMLLGDEWPNLKEDGPALDLADFDLFRGVKDEEAMAALRECVVEKSVPAGQAIFQSGDPGEEMFLVRRGLVRVALPMEAGRFLTLTTIPRGNFFGDMGFLDRGIRSAHATAVRDTDFYVLQREKFTELIRAHPEISTQVYARLARTLAVRLRQTDRELRGLLEN